MGPPRSFRSPRRSIVLLTLVALTVWLGACGDDDGVATTGSATAQGTPSDDLPAWLTDIYPSPGADAAERAVEVQYDLLDTRRELRVVIDGVDVTAQLDGLERGADGTVLFPSPGTVRYDPRELERPLVELRPGEHDVAVRLVELPAFGEPLRTVEEHAWSFVVQ
jgi:hypothetical protein